MITVTKLNKSRVILNSDLIEFIEKTPDTLITLTTGRKIMVIESPEELLESVIDYRRKTRSHPVPTGGGEPRSQR